MKNAEIARLVKRVKAGRDGAFDALFLEMWGTVYYLVRKQVRDSEDAADITQEVFVTVIKEIHTLKNNFAFNSWLYRIVLNACNTYLSGKKKADVVYLEELDHDLFENNKDFLPEELLSDVEASEAVLDMVSELPDEQRQAILLHYYSGLSAKEIADVMETTENAIHKKLSRARASIKTIVEERFMKGDA